MSEEKKASGRKKASVKPKAPAKPKAETKAKARAKMKIATESVSLVAESSSEVGISTPAIEKKAVEATTANNSNNVNVAIQGSNASSVSYSNNINVAGGKDEKQAVVPREVVDLSVEPVVVEKIPRRGEMVEAAPVVAATSAAAVKIPGDIDVLEMILAEARKDEKQPIASAVPPTPTLLIPKINRNESPADRFNRSLEGASKLIHEDMNRTIKRIQDRRPSDNALKLWEDYNALGDQQAKIVKQLEAVREKRKQEPALDQEDQGATMKRVASDDSHQEVRIGKTPETFDPSKDTIEGFEQRFKLYFRGLKPATERQKLDAVAAATALSKNEVIIEQVSRLLEQVETFDDFVKALAAEYNSLRSNNQAPVFEMEQGEHEVPAQYVAKFRLAAYRAQYQNNEGCPGLFLASLNKATKEALKSACRGYAKAAHQLPIGTLFSITELIENPSSSSDTHFRNKVVKAVVETKIPAPQKGIGQQVEGRPNYTCRFCKSYNHWFYACPNRSAAANEADRIKYKKPAVPEPLPVFNPVTKKYEFVNKKINPSSYTNSKNYSNEVDISKYTSKNNITRSKVSPLSSYTVLKNDLHKMKKSRDFEDNTTLSNSPLTHQSEKEKWFEEGKAQEIDEESFLSALLGPVDSQGSSIPEPFYLQVEIESRPCVAMIDPGTGVSILAKSFVEEAKLSFSQTDVEIAFADKRARRLPLLGQCQADITCHDRKVSKHKFYLLDLNSKAQCLIGRDLFFQLGTEIILPLPQTQLRNLKLAPDDEIDPNDTEALIGPVEQEESKLQEQMSKELDALIKDNEALPETGFCHLPYAVVPFKLLTASPVCVAQYPIAYHLMPKVREKVEDWHKRERIEQRRTHTPYNLPLTVAPKRDDNGQLSGVRVCLDLRKLNEVLEGEGFQTIDVNAVLRRYSGAEWFSEIDLSEAYLQLPVEEAHRHYLTFTFEGKQYSFKGAPFGAKHLTAFFQKVMNQLFTDFSFVNCYVDNIGIMSKTFEEHVTHCKQVLSRLNDAGLKINAKKCQWARRWIRTLGRIVTKDGIRADPSKVQGILKMRFPQSAKEVQTFLGVVNYMRDHIRGSANLTSRFDDIRDVVRFKHAMKIPEEKLQLERDFEKIKQAMANLLLLRHPDYDAAFHISCDASDVAMGAVLFQKKNAATIIIAVASQKFKLYEKRYSVHKKELRAIVYGLSKFRNYIWCSPHQVTLYTDHKALQNLYTAKELPRTYNGWLSIISDFNLRVSHVPGKDNTLADALSRLTCMAMQKHSPVKQQLPGENKETKDLVDSKRDSSLLDTESTFSQGRTSEPSTDQAELTAKDKRAIIKHHHSIGHFGQEATLARLKMAGFVWPRMRGDIEQEIKHCDACLKYNTVRPQYHELKTNKVDRPWQIVQADLISSVKQHQEFVAILVVKCCFSGYVVLRALQSKRAQEVAQKLFDIFSLYGPPEQIQADGGKEFTNELLNEVWDKLGVKRRFHTPYNPRAQGVVENAINSISKSIWKELRGHTDWPSTLTKIEFAFNTKLSPVTTTTPFFLMFGRNFWDEHHPDSTSIEGGRSWADQWEEVRKTLYPIVARDLEAKRRKQNQYFNDHHVLRKENLPKGTLVMIKDMNRANKEDQRFVGPYKVIRRMNDGCYAIEDANGLYASTVPINHMSIVDESPQELDQKIEQRYEIEEILDHDGSGPETKYLLKWKGYSSEEATWEPLRHIDDDFIIKQYWKKKEGSQKRKVASSLPATSRRGKRKLDPATK